MTQYSDEDIRYMAEEILDSWSEYIDECRRGGHTCVFCCADPKEDPKDVKHDETCAVLVARKILGLEETNVS